MVDFLFPIIVYKCTYTMKKNNLIRHLNKKTNVTYLYWGHSTHIPGQAYPKVEKKCIGKIDSEGEFNPNKTFVLLSPEEQMETGLVEQPYPPLDTTTKEFSDDIVSISDFNGRKTSLIFKSLEQAKQKVVVRYNRPIAVLLSIDAFAELTEEIENNALLVEALQRMSKSSMTYSTQELMEVLGISERELAEVEEDEFV